MTLPELIAKNDGEIGRQNQVWLDREAIQRDLRFVGKGKNLGFTKAEIWCIGAKQASINSSYNSKFKHFICKFPIQICASVNIYV
jgi:hypothetical protein